MPLTISELKQKWKREKEAYKAQEVGSGVHSFVKDVLECEALFNLKEGKLSTKLLQRKTEFIHEKKTRDGRRADFLIFISPEILIPIEAEQYCNIKAGEKQLPIYQNDIYGKYDVYRKYGILTDGNEWRFYNNNLYKSFSLIEILSDPSLIMDFWAEYIKPEHYYLSYFEQFGQTSLFKEAEVLAVEQNKLIFFEEITALIRSFKNKLKIEGYFEESGEINKEKRAVEITYAYIIQFILYKTLVDNDYDNYGPNYEEKVSAIHKNIKDGNYKNILGIIDGISSEISNNIYRPFAEEQKYIRDKLIELYQSVKNELSDVSPWLDIFIFIKKYNFANVKNDIFGYIYENYLKELYEDEQKGQYFTDPSIVNFMLEQIGYNGAGLKTKIKSDKDGISLIDPACGSGTFLYSAVDLIIDAEGGNTVTDSKRIESLVNNNIFGLDIAEFPLYLAEMGILMRMLPLIINEKYNNPIDNKIKVFKTKDSISEFLDTDLNNTINDLGVEGGRQESIFPADKLNLDYSSYVRDVSGIKEMKKSLESSGKIVRKRFDYVIGNPPYVSYKQCSKQNVLFLELMKQRKLKMSNIYGVNLHSTPDAPKKYAPNPNLYAFFIALGIALLKDNGKLCYIVPQTLLNAGDLDVLRYHLAKFTTIEKIILFSGKMFVGRGLKQNKPVATSSLIFVLNKHMPSLSHQVEIVAYTNPESDVEEALSNIVLNKMTNKSSLPQLDLLKNMINWSLIKQDKHFIELYDYYKESGQDMSIYYTHSLAKHFLGSVFYFDRGLKYPKDKVHLADENENGYFIAENNKNGYMAHASNYLIGTKYLDFPYGSQGENVYKQCYKITWRYMNFDRFRFSEDPIMVDYNNVIISSNNKNELLYLLALLNSALSTLIFNNFLRSENEKDILIGIKTIKEFIRVPKITKSNKRLKGEVIERTEEMLSAERLTLSDLVDFSGVMSQKHDRILVEGGRLILFRGEEEVKCKIKKNADLIKGLVNNSFAENKSIEKQILLSDLKSLPVIDFNRQKQLKDYIDDLVFALYFSVPLEKIGIDKAAAVKNACKKNKYYKLISK